ncbi:MAG: inorganic diphosphatase [Clostridia bacterium]|nr:inorganic diphosphatase [Clostridia bacterium]
MNIWHDIDERRIRPNNFIAFVEIERGSKNKYELDKETGLIILDRVLFTATHYPLSYGFIPKTLAQDEDPLDVFILCNQSIQSGRIVQCYPIGVISMLDNGARDDKIIAIPFNDPTYNTYRDISELPKHIFDEMSHFFSVYKSLEEKETVIDEMKGREEAIAIVERCIDRYIDSFCKGRISE